MNVDSWLYSRLNDQVAAVEGRITPQIGDQESAKPYIVYKLITEEPYATHDVPLQLTRHHHFEICTVADTDAVARTVGELAKTALVGYQGEGIQSVLLNGGTRKAFDAQTNEREYAFDISIWENLT